jgi:hypothetical protein
VIREAFPEDMPRIRELQTETETRIGMKMDLPEVGDTAILGYWVVERGGKIVRAFYEEKCIEHVEIGVDVQSVAEVRGFQQNVFSAAQAHGTRYLHCFVPPALDSWLGRMLFRVIRFLTSGTAAKIGKHLTKSGFKKTGFIHYNRRLR